MACDLYLYLPRELPFCKEVKLGGDVEGRSHILHYQDGADIRLHHQVNAHVLEQRQKGRHNDMGLTLKYPFLAFRGPLMSIRSPSDINSTSAETVTLVGVMPLQSVTCSRGDGYRYHSAEMPNPVNLSMGGIDMLDGHVDSSVELCKHRLLSTEWSLKAFQKLEHCLAFDEPAPNAAALGSALLPAAEARMPWVVCRGPRCPLEPLCQLLNWLGYWNSGELFQSETLVTLASVTPLSEHGSSRSPLGNHPSNSVWLPLGLSPFSFDLYPPVLVQEGECPNRLDPQNPAYAEETGPSVIVNGFSERPRASHSQRIRPNSENLARSRPRSVPVRLALVNSHQIRSLVSVGDSIPRSTDFVFHVPPPSAPPLDLGGLNPLLQFQALLSPYDVNLISSHLSGTAFTSATNCLKQFSPEHPLCEGSLSNIPASTFFPHQCHHFVDFHDLILSGLVPSFVYGCSLHPCLVTPILPQLRHPSVCLGTSYVHKIGIINFGYHLRKRRLLKSRSTKLEELNTSTPEEIEEINSKRIFMKIIEELKQEVKTCHKEMEEKYNKKIEEMSKDMEENYTKKFEEMSKSVNEILGNQEKTIKEVMETVQDLKTEMESMKKSQTEGRLAMENLGLVFSWCPRFPGRFVAFLSVSSSKFLIPNGMDQVVEDRNHIRHCKMALTSGSTAR
ncbi:hypothetical protein U0070_009491 [Myodes glareolus]|uniref:Uncharacterized protein n=1 Tax=Myodes glareolus TaxID=447135 RepID=A0AAW0I8U3_MYOGA